MTIEDICLAINLICLAVSFYTFYKNVKNLIEIKKFKKWDKRNLLVSIGVETDD